MDATPFVSDNSSLIRWLEAARRGDFDVPIDAPLDAQAVVDEETGNVQQQPAVDLSLAPAGDPTSQAQPDQTTADEGEDAAVDTSESGTTGNSQGVAAGHQSGGLAGRVGQAFTDTAFNAVADKGMVGQAPTGVSFGGIPESKSPNVGMTANMGLAWSEPEPQGLSTTNTGWSGKVTNVAGVPVGKTGTVTSRGTTTAQAPNVGVPAATVMDKPTQQVSAPTVGLNVPSEEEDTEVFGDDIFGAPTGETEAGGSGSDDGVGEGAGTGGPAGSGVGGVAGTDSAGMGSSAGQGEGGSGSGAGGGGQGGGGTGGGGNGGSDGSGASGEGGGSWLFGGATGDDGDDVQEPIKGTLHEGENVDTKQFVDLFGQDTFDQANDVAADDGLSDDEKRQAIADLFRSGRPLLRADAPQPVARAA